MPEERHLLQTLKFKGRRFQDHGLDLDMLGELQAYKALVVEAAKDRWRAKNPKAKRLPDNFEKSIRIKFYAVGQGSAAVDLMRIIETPEGSLPFEPFDEVEEGAKIIDLTIGAAGRDEPPPAETPASVIALFEKFGESLCEDESIELKGGPRTAAAVRYTPEVRERIGRWIEKTYEDSIDLTGEVRGAEIDGCQFSIRLEHGQKVPGRFDPKDEPLITEALREHETRRLRIRGKGEFSHRDGTLKRIIQAETPEILAAGEIPFDPTEKPFWEVIAEIGAKVPAEEWAKLPSNFSERIDEDLYGAGEAGA